MDPNIQTPNYTHSVQAGENLSTIAQNAGLTAAQFAALNPHLAASGAGSYKGLTNNVAIGTGYNLNAPKPVAPVAPVVTTPPATGTTVPVIPAAPATPTIGSIYNAPTLQEDPALTSARTASDTFYQNEASGKSNVDEAGIRASTLAQFQAEIDATNALYAQKLTDAKLLGAGRLGSSTAIQARGGLLGSDFGKAETDTVNNGNTSIYNGIDAEKNAAVQAILGKARQAGTDAIAEKTKAIGEGLDAHLKYLQDAGSRKTTNATAAAKFIYAQKLSPKDLSADQLAQTATGYGVTPQDITNAYTDVKKAGDEAAATAAATLAKNKKEAETILPEGSTVIDQDGKVISAGTPKTETVSQGQEVYKKNADGTYTKVITGPAKTFAPRAVPKTTATTASYKSFSAKPSSSNISKVNAYLTAHGGNAAAIAAANGDETNFYKVLNAANAEIKAQSLQLTVPPAQ